MAGKAEYQHLAKSVLLEEAGSGFLVRAIVWFSILIVGAFGAWAWFAEIKEVAVAQGEIVPTGKVQKIQHLEGGRIVDILVDDGAVVAAGQVVVRLDTSADQAALAQTVPELKALSARKERLAAFTRGDIPDFSALTQGDGEAVSYENRILEQVLLSQRANRDAITNQVGALQAELQELKTRRTALGKQAALLAEEIKMRNTLFKKGLTSKSLILALRRQKSELDGERAGLPAQRTRTEKRIAEAEARLRALDSDLIQEALEELATVETDLAKLQEERKHLTQRLAFTEIRTPVGGIVHGLKEHTVGAVIEPGQTVVEVVPVEGSLVAEIRIDPKDIGYIGPGQDVVLKFTSYEYARFGGMLGTLDHLSATTFRDETGAPYYKGVVPLSSGFLKTADGRYPLLPGMTLDADILTGEKTVFEYLLKPIYQSAGSALREK